MSFTSTLWKVPGKGGWTFADVPDAHAPQAAGPWGRTPVIAIVDGLRYETSVWRDKNGQTVLPVSAKVRRGKKEGDVVEIAIEPREGPKGG